MDFSFISAVFASDWLAFSLRFFIPALLLVCSSFLFAACIDKSGSSLARGWCLILATFFAVSALFSGLVASMSLEGVNLKPRYVESLAPDVYESELSRFNSYGGTSILAIVNTLSERGELLSKFAQQEESIGFVEAFSRKFHGDPLGNVLYAPFIACKKGHREAALKITRGAEMSMYEIERAMHFDDAQCAREASQEVIAKKMLKTSATK